MVFGFFKRAVSVFTGQGSDPPETEPASGSALIRVRRPSRAGLRARFEDDDDVPGSVPITPARRKRAVSESASRQTPAAKRPRVAVHPPSQPRVPKRPSAPKQPTARRARRPSLPSPPTSSPRATKSPATRAQRARKSLPASSSSVPDSSDEDYTTPRRLPLAVKTPTKAPLPPLFINDDGDAEIPEHAALRVEKLECTLFEAKPHLIQEVFAGNTWLVVLVSSMLDAHADYQRKEITAVFCSLSARWPTADAILSAPADEVKTILTPFAAYLPQLQTLAAVFVRCPITSSNWRTQSCWAPPYTPYVRDAYRTFCVRGEWQKVRPKPDSDLAQYLWRWARSGKMWDAQYGPVGHITTSQVRTIVVKCWAPLFHALPYSLATPHSTSTSVRIVQPST